MNPSSNVMDSGPYGAPMRESITPQQQLGLWPEGVRTHRVQGKTPTLDTLLAESRAFHPGQAGDYVGLIDAAAHAVRMLERGLEPMLADRLNLSGRPAGIAQLLATARAALARQHSVEAPCVSEGDPTPSLLVRDIGTNATCVMQFQPLFGAVDLAAQPPASLFHIRRMGRDKSAGAWICAGLAIHAAHTQLLLADASGVNAYTLHRQSGEFLLSRPCVQIPGGGARFAINAARARTWPQAVRRYIEECQAGRQGVRGQDFDMCWSGSAALETLHVLTHGGVCLMPADTVHASARTMLNPIQAQAIAFIVERAGGSASNGHARILDIAAAPDTRSTISLIFGARDEVARIERYHVEHERGLDREYSSPLFTPRGLFRVP